MKWSIWIENAPAGLKAWPNSTQTCRPGPRSQTVGTSWEANVTWYWHLCLLFTRQYIIALSLALLTWIWSCFQTHDDGLLHGWPLWSCGPFHPKCWDNLFHHTKPKHLTEGFKYLHNSYVHRATYCCFPYHYGLEPDSPISCIFKGSFYYLVLQQLSNIANSKNVFQQQSIWLFPPKRCSVLGKLLHSSPTQVTSVRRLKVIHEQQSTFQHVKLSNACNCFTLPVEH